MRGFTLLEMLVVIVIIGILAALVMPVLTRARMTSKGNMCANNLGQLGKALIMYSDVPSYAQYPTDKGAGVRGNPLPSLGILYRDYVSDYRVFSCSSKPTITQLTSLAPTIGSTPSSNPLNAAMTHYGYDPGNKNSGYVHSPNDSMAVIVADFTAAGANSDNHGPHAGQNVLLGAGSVEWRESISNTIDGEKHSVVDADITADSGITDTNWQNMESFISQ